MPPMICAAKNQLWLLGLALGALCVLCWGPALAQNHGIPQPKNAPAKHAPPTSREEARDMVSRLSDEAVRDLLLEHLDRSLPAANQALPEQDTWLLTNRDSAVTQLRKLLARRGDLRGELQDLHDKVTGGQQHPWLMLLASVIICLLTGVLLERAMLRPNGILGSLRARGQAPDGDRLTAGQVLLGATARSTGTLLFLLGAVVALNAFPGLSSGGRVLASAVIWLVCGTRMVSTGVHALLLPQGGTSPWPMSDAVARAIARQVSIVAPFIIFILIDRALLAELGAEGFFIKMAGLAQSTLAIAAIINAIFAVRRAQGTDAPARQAQRTGVWSVLQERWHYVAAAYVIGVYIMSVYARLVTGDPMLMRALGSLALLLLIPMLDYAIVALAARLAPSVDDANGPAPVADDAGSMDAQRGVLDLTTPRSSAAADSAATALVDDTGDAVPPPAASRATGREGAELDPTAPQTLQPHIEAEPTPLRDALVENFRILLALGLVQAMCLLWGIRLFDVAQSLFGERLAGALLEILVASLFAFVVWRVLKAALVAHTPPEVEGTADGEIGGTGLTRAQTLMPLIANTVGVALVVIIAMISLSAFGVDIAPMLAGAGIIGLAIGFGAQTLVKDIVSGVFFLVDDAFRMGEYLEIGDIRGTVERIAVRSLRMRHHRGALHTVPYGEITHITNYSRDFAIMKFEIRVPFETDVETVRKLIKRVGTQLMENEEVAPVMLEPLKSQGVNRMDDSSFVIRCKFMTLPGKQFTVRRFAYAMIQDAFAAEGIQFAPKRVIVETTAPPGSREALAAAAAAAHEGDTPEPPKREDR